MQPNTTNPGSADLALDEPTASLDQPVTALDARAAGLDGVAPSGQSEPMFTQDSPTLGSAGATPLRANGRGSRWTSGWAVALMILAGVAAIAFFAMHQHRADNGLTHGLPGEAAPNLTPDKSP